jgi:hypothetical protein
MMLRFTPLFLASLLLGCSAWGTTTNQTTTAPREESAVAGGDLRARYPLANANQKIVDNRGDGFENLYGTRNVRAVLNGVYYRGGANNAYHRTKRRDNSNPLPNDGLENLCQEGFGAAVYLYSTNYGTAPKTTTCRTRQGNHVNQLSYSQISPLSYNRGDLRQLLTLVHDHIRDGRKGAIYDHCWNGWHASGYVAATTLRQFCGFTAEQAVAYWNQNTDGNNGSAYERVRRSIRAFEPFPELTISDAEKRALCPAPGSLQFNAQ